jgi:hypothetical protein
MAVASCHCGRRKSRVERIIKSVPGYAGLVPLGSSWSNFLKIWVKELDRQGVQVGVNWSGPNATGFEFPASVVAGKVQAVAGKKQPNKRLQPIARKTRSG